MCEIKSLSPLPGLGIFSLLDPGLTPGAIDMPPALQAGWALPSRPERLSEKQELRDRYAETPKPKKRIVVPSA